MPFSSQYYFEDCCFYLFGTFIGMVVAFGFTLLVLHICRRAHPNTAEMWFKKLQLVSSALFSIGHGLNDSQKVMGIIAAALDRCSFGRVKNGNK